MVFDIDGDGGKGSQIEREDPTRRKKDRERNGAARGCQSLLLSVTQNCLTGGGPAKVDRSTSHCACSSSVSFSRLGA